MYTRAPTHLNQLSHILHYWRNNTHGAQEDCIQGEKTTSINSNPFSLDADFINIMMRSEKTSKLYSTKWKAGFLRLPFTVIFLNRDCKRRSLRLKSLYLFKSCTLIYEKIWVKIFWMRIEGTWNKANRKLSPGEWSALHNFQTFCHMNRNPYIILLQYIEKSVEAPNNNLPGTFWIIIAWWMITWSSTLRLARWFKHGCPSRSCFLKFQEEHNNNFKILVSDKMVIDNFIVRANILESFMNNS